MSSIGTEKLGEIELYLLHVPSPLAERESRDLGLQPIRLALQQVYGRVMCEER